MVSDDDIAACIRARVEAYAPCPRTKDEFYTWLHTNIESMYWACGGYSAGGIGSHEIRVREAFDKSQLNIAACKQSPSGDSSMIGMLIIAGAAVAALVLLSGKSKRR